MSHSPAPWSREGSSILDAAGTRIATVIYQEPTSAGYPASANGMLMAAAPDLLEVCVLALGAMGTKTLIDPSYDYSDVMRTVEAALIKATKET